jgi:hypothetical protein
MNPAQLSSELDSGVNCESSSKGKTNKARRASKDEDAKTIEALNREAAGFVVDLSISSGPMPQYPGSAMMTSRRLVAR